MDIYTKALTSAKREAQSRVVVFFWTVRGISATVLRRMQHENQRIESVSRFSANPLSCWFIGGPDRDRTDDLFHAMEAAKAKLLTIQWL